MPNDVDRLVHNGKKEYSQQQNGNMFFSSIQIRLIVFFTIGAYSFNQHIGFGNGIVGGEFYLNVLHRIDALYRVAFAAVKMRMFLIPIG